MSRKSKIDPVLKVELVERYLRNEIGVMEAARLAGLSSHKSFSAWVSIYRNEGPGGLLDQDHNKNYPKELKLAAVTAYKNGEGALEQLTYVLAFGQNNNSDGAMALKYDCSYQQVRNWVLR